jgi:hypothetical protein
MLSLVAKKRKRGQPKHVADPPVALATTIPESFDRALRKLARVKGRPCSEHLAEAIRTHLAKHKN